MEQAQVKRIVEAVLFVTGDPVSLKRLVDLMPELTSRKARELIQELNAEYRERQRAFFVQEVAGGYQMVTQQDLASWVMRALERPKPDTVRPAALETLAIIAYRQPIAKAEIEAIRGVDVTASLETLLERQFIRVAGRRESPGRPFVYATTTEFLRHFGLRSLEALPAMPTPAVPEYPAAVLVAQEPSSVGLELRSSALPSATPARLASPNEAAGVPASVSS
jgi:segregation and condensation protein B